MSKKLQNLFFVFLFAALIFTGCSSSGPEKNVYEEENLAVQIYPDTIKAGKFDNGTMWTFENPPLDYFESEYGFRPTKEWLDHVRMSALRFANYCSASFVSGDGLLMTNHHCGRDAVSSAQKEGEDLHESGFYAETIEQERRIDKLYVDQLVRLIDVTKEVQAAFDSGKDDTNKVSLRNNKIKELEQKYSAEMNLVCKVTSLYNGGEYYIYGYKRYNDIRLVFAPEDQIGFFGGDPDNFTYPRYNLDMTFFRVYDENGKPLKTEHYFKWNPNGAEPGDPVFVVGNPGRTDRLKTVAQLEFDRDVVYPRSLARIHYILDSLKERVAENPDLKKELNNQIFGLDNSRKVVEGILKGLKDITLMARRVDFEKNFRNSVNSKPELKAKYGNVWDEIKELVKARKKVIEKIYGTDTLTAKGKETYAKLIVEAKELAGKESAKIQMLGKAIYEVYGTSIPPDATFTLRISDGIIKGYDYNGTVAPPYTTYFGVYDRFYSFDKQYPWSLPDKWKNPPEEFDLSVPMNFVSTNDIIGGNSGSPLIDKNAEVVGLAFDGNIESLPGRFIFTTEANRTVSVHSKGILEALKHLYKVKALVDELINGKIAE
ncbi:MAG: S46 family peptidase [Ignavibacteria bacterium]|nr:S46 family peptidase [Ignavibacteria bacterium]